VKRWFEFLCPGFSPIDFTATMYKSPNSRRLKHCLVGLREDVPRFVGGTPRGVLEESGEDVRAIDRTVELKWFIRDMVIND
jgi:hypothetical protein